MTIESKCPCINPATMAACTYSDACNDHDARQHIGTDGSVWRTGSPMCVCNGFGFSESGSGERSACASCVQGRARRTARDNVREFHQAFGIPVLDSPQMPSADRVRLRAKLITEEFFETIAAMFPRAYTGEAQSIVLRAIEDTRAHVDIVEMADGLADLVYVCEGTFHEFGLDSDPIHAEVHRSNMAKVGGTVREDGKLLKPAGWTPPDIEGVLRAQAK